MCCGLDVDTHGLVGRVAEFLAEQLALPVLGVASGEGGLESGDDERHVDGAGEGGAGVMGYGGGFSGSYNVQIRRCRHIQ